MFFVQFFFLNVKKIVSVRLNPSINSIKALNDGWPKGKRKLNRRRKIVPFQQFCFSKMQSMRNFC